MRASRGLKWENKMYKLKGLLMANQTHSCVHPGTRVTQGVRFHACVLEPQWRFDGLHCIPGINFGFVESCSDYIRKDLTRCGRLQDSFFMLCLYNTTLYRWLNCKSVMYVNPKPGACCRSHKSLYIFATPMF